MSLNVFLDSEKRPVSGDGGVASFPTGISQLTSCLNVASLAAALLAFYFTKWVASTVKVDGFMMWRTNSCVK